MGFLNTDSMPRLVEKLADGDNIKITGNSKGNRVGTVIKKIVEKADEVTKAIEQEVINDSYSFKVGTGDVDVSSDVEDGFGEVGVKGVTYQNLWNINKVNGATIEGNTVKVLASANDYKFCGIYLKDSCLKPNTTYTLITNVFENTLDGRFNPCIGHSASVFKTNAKEFQAKTTGVSISVLTTTSAFTTENIGVRTFLLNDCTEGFIKYNMLILEGDHTNNPNLPSYFEGIVGIGDKSKNLFDGALQQGYWYNGTLRPSKYAIANTHNIAIKPCTNYTFSVEDYDGIIYIAELDSSFNEIKSHQIKSKQSITTSNGSYLRFCTANDELYKLSTNTKVQIEEGSIATSYEPYYDGHKIEILSNSKNLFNAKDVQRLTFNATTLVLTSGNEAIRSFTFKIKANTTYNVSEISNLLTMLNSSCVRVLFTYEEPQVGMQSIRLPNIDVKVNTIKHTSDGYVTMTFLNANGNWDENTWYSNACFVQVEESPIPTPYTSYVEDKTQILLDEPLMRLPNGICDEITRDGKLIRKIKKIKVNRKTLKNNVSVWDFPEDISKNYIRFYRYVKDMELNGIRFVNSVWKSGYCNIIGDNSNGYRQEKEAFGVTGGALGYLSFSIKAEKIPNFDFNNYSSISNQELILDYLEKVDMTVYFEMETPLITDIIPPSLRIFKDGHITFNTLVAPESSHLVQLNKSAQIERSIREVQSLDSRVGKLESFYDDMMLETSHKLSLLNYDFEYTRERNGE